MLRKISRAWFLLFHPKLLKVLLSLPWNGYLKDLGWFNAFSKNASIDLDGNPIPWVSYPFLEFIRERLNKNLHIFEYGSGNSTLFYAKNVSSVTSVEHNEEWFLKVKKLIPENVQLHYCELSNENNYSEFINKVEKRFDIVIVDGRNRVNCIKHSIDKLTDSGIVILDNSERTEYKPGIDLLLRKEFRYIDFWGIAPAYNHKTCTTIFYKDKNCLGI